MRKPLIIITVLLLALPGLTAAEMYKWVDANGQVHYSERPPSAGNYESVKPLPAATEPEPAIESVNHDVKERNDSMAEEARKQQLEAANKEVRDINCRNARTRYSGFRRTGRVFTTDEAGNRHYYSDQERADEMAALEQVIEQNCD